MMKEYKLDNFSAAFSLVDADYRPIQGIEKYVELVAYQDNVLDLEFSNE